jgi:exonuclease III
MLRLPALLALAAALPLGTAGCGGSAPAPAPPAPPPPPAADAPFRFEVEPAPTFRADGFRIATFNGEFLFDGVDDEGGADFPWKGDPAAARAHRQEVAAVIRALDADVVVIPETENLEVLQAMATEDLAGMGYTPHFVQGQDSFTGQDVGLLARVAVDTTFRTDERVAVGTTDRLYGVSKNIVARFSIGDQPVSLVGVHFLAQPDNAERRPQREAQAEVIRRLVEREAAAGRAVVVAGDLNDFDPEVLDVRGSRPISNVLATIRAAGPGPADDLANVLADVPQRGRFTSLYDRNADGVIVQDDLSAIDHVLLSPALYRRVREVRAVHMHDPFEVTDHFPLVVTLAD